MKKLINTPIWQQLLVLFSPILLAILFNYSPFSFSSGQKESITYLLFFSSIFLALCWQYYLGSSFLKRTNQSSNFFKINGIIPIIFWSFVLLQTCYSMFKSGVSDANVAPNNMPIRPTNSLWVIIIPIVQLLFLHSIITFFINLRIISKKNYPMARTSRENAFYKIIR